MQLFILSECNDTAGRAAESFFNAPWAMMTPIQIDMCTPMFNWSVTKNLELSFNEKKKVTSDKDQIWLNILLYQASHKNGFRFDLDTIR